MDWIPVVSTVVGGLVGVGATVITDRGRWGREEIRRVRETRCELYGQHVLALHDAGEQLRAVALADLHTDVPKEVAARQAFRSANLPAVLERMRITAPTKVVEPAGTAFHAMRTLRNCVSGGMAVGSAEYRQAELACEEAHRILRNAMRLDLETR